MAECSRNCSRRLLAVKGNPARAVMLDLRDEGVDVVVLSESSIAARGDSLRQIGQADFVLEDAIVDRRDERLSRDLRSMEICPEQVSRAGVVVTARSRLRS